MYIYIQIPFYLRFQNEKIAQQHWFKLQTSSYSSWEEEEEESGMRTGMVGFCTHLLCSLSVFILFVLYYSPFCCFATTTTASMHLSPAGPPPGGPNTAHNICSLLQQGKNDRIWQDKIHTYSTRPHDSIPFCYLQGGGDCLLVECEIPFLFLILFLHNSDIVQLLSSHGKNFTGNPSFDFDWGAWLDCEMD
jgi:hypothetical protein